MKQAKHQRHRTLHFLVRVKNDSVVFVVAKPNWLGKTQFPFSRLIEPCHRGGARAIDEVRPEPSSPLNTEQTAPYVAYCGCTATVISESSACCGQSGRIRRVFWGPHPRGCSWRTVVGGWG